jgi:hypothetical protein
MPEQILLVAAVEQHQLIYQEYEKWLIKRKVARLKFANCVLMLNSILLLQAKIHFHEYF